MINLKANYGSKVKRLSKAESMAISRTAADSAFPAIMAAVLFVLYKRGWHKDRLIKLYDDVCALLTMPSIFGQYLDDRQIEEYLTKQVGIDWDKIRSAIRIEV